GILVVPAGAPPEYLGGYLGPYRLLRSDLVVFTMASGPSFRTENLSELLSHVQRWNPDARIVITDLDPGPMGDVRGKTVFLATTAPPIDAPEQVSRLQSNHGCTVVGWSAALSDRPQLTADLQEAPGFEVLLTELKAAAVDVGVKQAIERGSEVVFLDNRPVAIDGETDVDDAIRWALELAISRKGVG
ncbi:MAG: 2,3-diphosphoglycerate synthetase, partial [Actinobacteria bacterium]|nr:2,3-diphosphoglycerate synthetase [Actinomycetota bacterium]